MCVYISKVEQEASFKGRHCAYLFSGHWKRGYCAHTFWKRTWNTYSETHGFCVIAKSHYAMTDACPVFTNGRFSTVFQDFHNFLFFHKIRIQNHKHILMSVNIPTDPLCAINSSLKSKSKNKYTTKDFTNLQSQYWFQNSIERPAYKRTITSHAPHCLSLTQTNDITKTLFSLSASTQKTQKIAILK